ncbi:MAG TPA: response regulator transcription factor [Acidimicrobiia bacterium]|jgi:two-component system nitrate/nitrite response regulator NarL|nr:response regulator transcription factor [Acidimicrobiia bacterium]
MNVVICDDHRLFTDALARVLTARDWNVVACAIDPAHAVAAVATEPVDTCLMDLTFADGDSGIQGITAVHTASSDTKVVVLTASRDPLLIMRAVDAGADAIVFKDDDIDHIVEVAERGAPETNAHQVARARRHDARERAGSLERSSGDDLVRFLTDREREVLDRLVQGESSKQVALHMGIAYSTARTHIQNILAKLGVHSRLEAVAFAVEHGLRVPTRSPTRSHEAMY